MIKTITKFILATLLVFILLFIMVPILAMGTIGYIVWDSAERACNQYKRLIDIYFEM